MTFDLDEYSDILTDNIDTYIQTGEYDTSEISDVKKQIEDYENYSYKKFDKNMIGRIITNPGNFNRDDGSYERALQLIKNIIDYYNSKDRLHELHLNEKIYDYALDREVTILELLNRNTNNTFAYLTRSSAPAAGGKRKKVKKHNKHSKRTKKTKKQTRKYKKTNRRKHKMKRRSKTNKLRK
jgi:hypothetical protein